MMGKSYGLRRRLGRIRQRVTGDDLDMLRNRVAELSGEVSTLAAQLRQSGWQPPAAAEVGLLSDFRLRGGTTASIAQEAQVQSAAGISTALIHVQSGVTNSIMGFSDHIRSALEFPGVCAVSPRSETHVRLLIIRHPHVIATSAPTLERLTADQVVVVANHAAVDAEGSWHYRVALVDQRAREKFGVTPEWAPISPVVRASILAQNHRDIRLAADDWVNIFGTVPTTTPRTGFVDEKPVIGRHSRPEPEKWPATAGGILAAYPDSSDYRVEVLGGAEIPEQILGAVPAAWHVQPFGAEEPAAFLQRIDFWVYMHHHSWREAFGRAIMEALAAGCVVVLPGYLREIFGEAALYAEPSEVLALVNRYWEDQEAYLEQSRRGQLFAAEHGPTRHLQRLQELGVSAS
ncbi:glycosyltransferase [Nesterenkonia muleiensis]|uniref:glycosyltransferase n=1 Tax=Nesterenkonia muleiensis TaxID=2282648 RepID=UPI000E74B681|nr:glycosyltransferase [Nesterenkonia muleiensis]